MLGDTGIVIAVGERSLATFTGRTSVTTAELLSQQATVFPSHHGGFVGADSVYACQPEALTRTPHDVLTEDNRYGLGRNPSWRPDVGRLVVMNHVTLDGVMQAPGRPDEDTRGGFTQGGWGSRSTSAGDAAGKAMGERMAAGGGLAGWLFGRRTYEGLLATWNARGGPFKDSLNNSPKYVASTTLKDPLPWPNSTLLGGDVAEAVGALKARSDGVLAIMGSGELIGSLMAADLIDEYLLMIHPLVLGGGRRLFPANARVTLRLTDSVTTSTGVVIATYEPARE